MHSSQQLSQLGPRQISTNFSYLNGKQTFEQSYTYTIQPKKKGVFTIPSATIKFDGNTINTNTVKVTVTGAVEIPKDLVDSWEDPRGILVEEQYIEWLLTGKETSPILLNASDALKSIDFAEGFVKSLKQGNAWVDLPRQ